ncbi:hypothetical protein [Shewanella litorisediminis]|uniref:Uncharacterized protein n=1 Tax=Shewanella litorisediminis TaxID=1173586 RepID=A0ABX7G5J4_9GAMM|nr:hypothetical protein [Shewanella litorisediminis]MCL2917455.1 hypothetical protein [Shewanella litorisediminis]QRH02586.1 hypothetical protein JQC75_03960 [Shewanella litorisediminis]
MQFLLKSVLLLGSLAWLAVCAKTLLSLGVMDNPSIVKEHLFLVAQVVVALVILRSVSGKRS